MKLDGKESDSSGLECLLRPLEEERFPKGKEKGKGRWWCGERRGMLMDSTLATEAVLKTTNLIKDYIF